MYINKTHTFKQNKKLDDLVEDIYFVLLLRVSYAAKSNGYNQRYRT